MENQQITRGATVELTSAVLGDYGTAAFIARGARGVVISDKADHLGRWIVSWNGPYRRPYSYLTDGSAMKVVK